MHYYAPHQGNGRWLERGLVCLDIRSFNFFCFFKPSILLFYLCSIWKRAKIAIELKIIIFNFFIRFKKIYFCQIWLYSFKVEIKSVRNVILNNIDNNNNQPSRMHRSPSWSRQNFPDSKNSKIWQIWYRYFRFDYRVFLSRWKLSEMII